MTLCKNFFSELGHFVMFFYSGRDFYPAFQDLRDCFLCLPTLKKLVVMSKIEKICHFWNQSPQVKSKAVSHKKDSLKLDQIYPNMNHFSQNFERKLFGVSIFKNQCFSRNGILRKLSSRHSFNFNLFLSIS